ncbi:hypothetical protein D0Y50_07990 [Salinimonas sediminis]|uniref:Uncharacterized protein n=1 Tax=Salinimonas sediminis TaxID=2303538 RepID=A0A346NLA0_9ALTE|nr:hypothetical protein D0Y50_07990 [Salinimonas sediminis]
MLEDTRFNFLKRVEFSFKYLFSYYMVKNNAISAMFLPFCGWQVGNILPWPLLSMRVLNLACNAQQTYGYTISAYVVQAKTLQLMIHYIKQLIK